MAVVGGATAAPGNLQLLFNTAGEATAAWIPTAYTLTPTTSFQASFTYVVSGGSSVFGQADGITFAVQGIGLSSVGFAGSGMGYIGGIAKSAAVGLDSYQNFIIGGPLYYNAVYILNPSGALASAASPVPLSTNTNPPTFPPNNGTTTVNVVVNYTAATHTLSATVGGQSAISAQINLLNNVGSTAYFGFTASTGAAWMNATVTGLSLTILNGTSPTPPPPPPVINLFSIATSFQQLSAASQQQIQQTQSNVTTIFDYLAHGGAGPSGPGTGGPGIGPGPTGPGSGGATPTDNPGGGSANGRGGFDPQKYPASFGTLSDPSGEDLMRYAPERSLPGVFKAMPPAGSSPVASSLPSVWSGFILGAIGGTQGDANGGGTFGVQRAITGGATVGATLGATVDRTVTPFNGTTRTDTGSASVFAAGVPDAGLQWMLVATSDFSALDLARGYLSAGAPAISSGNTHGIDYGAAARVGWSFTATPIYTLTPYASYVVTHSRIGSYVENNGPTPAQFSTIDQTVQITRLGVEGRQLIGPGRWLFGGMDWAHQFEPTSPQVNGTLIGLFPLSIPGSSVDQNWLETTGGVRLALAKDTSLMASVTTAFYARSAARFLASVNLTQNF
jgi:uncharacterized protein YhjY with autotransporter beta-barrel domain